MIAGGIRRIFKMLHLQPGSLHALKKSETSVNHLDERIFEKMLQPHQFFWKLLASVGFFPFDYNTKSEKEDESKRKFWWIKLQMINV